MPDKLVLDFPVLQQEGCDFFEEVSYEVKAEQTSGKLKIAHTIKGQSFIRQLIENGDAEFSVLLIYRDSSERQSHACKADNINDDEIVATQIIPMDFSYAPEILPSIILTKGRKIAVEKSSGLTDFWGQGEYLDIPKYSRIALGQKLKFTSGDISNLMNVKPDEKLRDGEMKVVVNENAGEGETPVSLLCGKDVYDELNQIKKAEPPSDARGSMRSAIVTSALCAVYAHMHAHLQKRKLIDEAYPISGVLAAHLEMLEEKTDESWENDEFSPSLTATKMWPYAIKALYSEVDYD